MSATRSGRCGARPGFAVGRRPHARARHRRDHGHLQRRRHDPAAAAARSPIPTGSCASSRTSRRACRAARRCSASVTYQEFLEWRTRTRTLADAGRHLLARTTHGAQPRRHGAPVGRHGLDQHVHAARSARAVWDGRWARRRGRSGCRRAELRHLAAGSFSAEPGVSARRSNSSAGAMLAGADRRRRGC